VSGGSEGDGGRHGPGSIDARVDHVGIAVHAIADAEPLLELFGAEKLIEEADHEQGFTWAYYELGGASRLELIESIEGEESFLTDYLERSGPGLHHVTVEVADVDATVETLEAGGVTVVDHAEREGYTEAFVPPSEANGVLYQLMEYHDDYADEHGAAALIGGAPLWAVDGDV
jgi:methylmalonyl-CoA/ethylmalonyl-CoA epimerase